MRGLAAHAVTGGRIQDSEVSIQSADLEPAEPRPLEPWRLMKGGVWPENRPKCLKTALSRRLSDVRVLA